MKFPRRKLLHFAVGAVALPLLPRAARAQVFPSRPITMIVPASAGGPTDTIGRILLERMQASLGQSVVVENVAGAGGTIATGRVARARSEEHTSELQSRLHLVCRLLLEKKKKKIIHTLVTNKKQIKNKQK